jgi:multidrug efflux pump subunit AcrA (membrane-fusion protein)
VRRAAAAAVLLALAALGCGGGEEAAGGRSDHAAVSTARVERRDLVQRESVTGTLGFSDERPVLGGLPGTITRLPEEGATVARGEALYEVDGRPVILLDGERPAWRPLAEDDRGRDVLQLERNLAALGYTGGGGLVVDGRYTATTREAVEDWQADNGLKESGVVELGRVVFAPGAERRVGEVKVTAGAGSQPGTEVLATTSARPVVTVALAVDKQSLARRGAGVKVELPDGDVVNGRIAAVGSVATTDSSGGDGSDPSADDGSGSGDATIDVTIALRGRLRTRLDQAPVAVDLAKEAERDTLAVPVGALVARAGGGYSVDVSERDGLRRAVPVRPGLFADGWVGITGRRLREGMRVVVAE